MLLYFWVLNQGGGKAWRYNHFKFKMLYRDLHLKPNVVDFHCQTLISQAHIHSPKRAISQPETSHSEAPSHLLSKGAFLFGFWADQK